jgi:hypothetical protein
MEVIGLAYSHENFKEITAKAANGESFSVKRDGKSVFKIEPIRNVFLHKKFIQTD